MSGFVGADVQELRALARKADVAAGRFGSLTSNVATRLSRIEWSGPDRDKFDATQLRSVRETMQTAKRSLSVMATNLRRQADEQEEASNKGGSISDFPFIPSFIKGTGPQTIDQQIDATRRGMENDLANARARLAELKAMSRPDGLGNWIADRNPFDESDSEKLDRMIKEEEAKINRLEKLLENPNRQFLKVDASGDGRIIEVYGDLSTADHVAIHIPGMSNSIDKYLGANGHSDASSLYDTLVSWTPKNGANVAVISFMDYDAPDGYNFEGNNKFDIGSHLKITGDVVGEKLARDGAKNLDSLVTSLNQQGVGSEKITVVAHSYGSVVAGNALRDGLDVRRAVVVGSPGLGQGINSVADLRSNADLYVGGTIDDGVIYTAVGNELTNGLAGHGQSPYMYGYGAKMISTDGSSGHSEYFTGTSLNSIAQVVMGDHDK